MPSSGVDELVVPSPDPKPADFVAEIDNPWWPMRQGHTWASADKLSFAVTSGRGIAGVETTGLEERDGEGVSTYFCAQDRAGNVWLFAVDAPGASEDWEVTSGLGAGLLLPARPRAGDGFVTSPRRSGDDITSIVESTDASLPYRDGLEHLVHVVVTDAATGEQSDWYYQRDIGPVAVVRDGVVSELVLR